MATWTNESKGVATAEVDFLFSDATDFLFSDSTDYVFMEQVNISWTNQTKS